MNLKNLDYEQQGAIKEIALPCWKEKNQKKQTITMAQLFNCLDISCITSVIYSGKLSA